MIPPSLMLPKFAKRMPESVRRVKILDLVSIRLPPCQMQLPELPTRPDQPAGSLLQTISTIDLIDQVIRYLLTPKKKKFTFRRLNFELQSIGQGDSHQ
jgi:hypothetical protein